MVHLHSHTWIWHFKLSSFFALFLFSSRNPQVADIYGFLLDHWLLHGVHMVMFNHVLLVFSPFLFNFSNFFSSSSKHKNVRLLLVLIIILEVSIQMMMIIHMMMVWCQKLEPSQNTFNGCGYFFCSFALLKSRTFLNEFKMLQFNVQFAIYLECGQMCTQ